MERVTLTEAPNRRYSLWEASAQPLWNWASLNVTCATFRFPRVHRTPVVVLRTLNHQHPLQLCIVVKITCVSFTISRMITIWNSCKAFASGYVEDINAFLNRPSIDSVCRVTSITTCKSEATHQLGRPRTNHPPREKPVL